MLIASLGEQTSVARVSWLSETPSTRFLHLGRPSPSGLRWDSRLLGIGVDALRLVPRLWRQSEVLATNPWVGVAAILAQAQDVATVGIYAEPESRSWRLLRTAIQDRPVVATSSREAALWNLDGGHSTSVLWGGTFPLPPRRQVDSFRIFVGGSSDRDTEAIQDLSTEVQLSDQEVTLVIADGSGPRTWRGRNARISWLPYVPQQTFLRELSHSSISWLPLIQSQRAAGHMVFVASLQAGIPVVVSDTEGIREYLRAAGMSGYRERPSLEEFKYIAEQAQTQKLFSTWREVFSTQAYVRSVVEALQRLEWDGLTSETGP